MYKRLVILAMIGFSAAYLMYDGILPSLLCMVFFVIYGIINKRGYIEAAKRKTRECFLDFLMCLEPLLKTSGTFGGAFSEAVSDYRRFHGNDGLSAILGSSANEFGTNIPTGEILGKLAKRLDIEDARMFAGSMAICEATGGSAVEITEKTTQLLVGKTRILCDINTSLTGKIFEQKVITAMPFVLLLILRTASGPYIAPLYESLIGRAIMTFAGILFLASWVVGRKIVDIRV